LRYCWHVSPAQAQPFFNSNGTPANVQTLVNGAVDGDTVTIPSGNFTWASSVTISGKGVKIQGKDQAAL
jgi:hypothetical protein